MGCSSYLRAPDPKNPSHELFLQFKYGFLREIQYNLGDEIEWEARELSPMVDVRADALVPAWETQGARHFALTIEANKIVDLSEIPAAEADRLFEERFDRNSRHAWKI